MTSSGEKASISPQRFLPHVTVTYHVTELIKMKPHLKTPLSFTLLSGAKAIKQNKCS